MLDPFYLIVDEAAWLDRLLPQGLRLVQLRVKDRSEEETRTFFDTDTDGLMVTVVPISPGAGLAIFLTETTVAAWAGTTRLRVEPTPTAAARRSGVSLRKGMSVHECGRE